MVDQHMYVPDSGRININALRREARKRLEREGRETVIHLHEADDGECNHHDEHHELYEVES